MAQNSNAPIKSISMRQLFISGVIATVSTLRHNENKYPYVTLINKKGESSNLYFGKKSAERIDAAYNGGDAILKELKEATIVESMNADDQMRHKLSLKGETDYASSAELASLFGVEEEAGEFNVGAFKATFSAAPAVPDPAEATQPAPTTQANSAAIKAAAKTAGKGK